MGDWFIATEGVKVVKDSASLWPQIITAVTSIGAALGGVSLTHYYTRRREVRAAADNAAAERLYITTELVFLLERYAYAWVPLHWSDIDKRYNDIKNIPSLDLSKIGGDWRILTVPQIFKIRSIEADSIAIKALIMTVDYKDYLPVAKPLTYRCYLMGLRALLLAAHLRRDVGLPDSKQLTGKESMFRKLRENRRELWHWLVQQDRATRKAVKLFTDPKSINEEIK